jgi:hypothetical protein
MFNRQLEIGRWSATWYTARWSSRCNIGTVNTWESLGEFRLDREVVVASRLIVVKRHAPTIDASAEVCL